MIKIGVTERGDAGIDLSWADKLLPANIIITKNPTSKRFHDLILANKDKIILHIGCTGFGGTSVEPNVPTPAKVYDTITKLWIDGFPEKQMVLRTDPIIPTKEGLQKFVNILNLFETTFIKRVRFSFLDMYKHVKIRFMKEFGKLPYQSYNPPQEMMDETFKIMEIYEPRFHFESCAEKFEGHDFIERVGCVSHKDLQILGIKPEGQAIGYQRPLCLCLSGKTELLTHKQQCPHKCAYCYWQG